MTIIFIRPTDLILHAISAHATEDQIGMALYKCPLVCSFLYHL